MRDFDFIVSPAKLLTPEIVQMVSSIHEHKGKQELFLEANVDELKTLLEVALIQSTGASITILTCAWPESPCTALISDNGTHKHGKHFMQNLPQ